jgi:hypothetical protein
MASAAAGRHLRCGTGRLVIPSGFSSATGQRDSLARKLILSRMLSGSITINNTKEGKMNIRCIAACILATAAIGAWAADVTSFRTINETASVTGCSTRGVCTSVSVQRADDLASGSMSGSIAALISNPSGPIFFQIVNCSGPAFADALVVNHANGDATINVTLEPSMPGCTGVNFFEPFVIELTGRATGNVHISVDGFFTNELNGSIFRGKTREDRFTDDFEGTVGPLSGPIFGGAVSATRNSRHEQMR